MRIRHTAGAVAASACAAACLAAVAAPPATAAPPFPVDMSCVSPAGDPAPGTPAWFQRDAANEYCASLRNRDQLTNPAFGVGNLSQGASLWADQLAEQVGDGAGHIHGGITTLIPGSQAADPFRTIARWTEEGRGSVVPIKFLADDGAQLRGHIFMPPKTIRKPRAGYPAVVITDGSVQAYENLYFWAAEDLASHGYMVMTYDVQGQGDSDLFPANCPNPADALASCPGVPYQQNYNFYQGAEDSLNFLLSSPRHRFGGSYDPEYRDLNRNEVAIAGHSLGAAAVSVVGQCDTRVKTIVAWDDLDPITEADCQTVNIPKADRTPAAELIHTPALALTNDYLFNTEPMSSPPDPHSKDGGYQQLVKAGVDSEIVAFRGATHLTYTYIPLVFQASELDERMASYYTLAWLDYDLRHRASGYARLTAKAFDSSADTDSIGAGVWDPAKAVPGDPYSGNVPYKIKGIEVKNAVSFYYLSEYALRDPSGALATCADMRRDNCQIPSFGTP